MYQRRLTPGEYKRISQSLYDEVCTSCGTYVAQQDVTDDHYDADDQFHCTACWEKDDPNVYLSQCVGCNLAQVKSNFSKSQLKKSLATRRCSQCVKGGSFFSGQVVAVRSPNASAIRVKLPKKICAKTNKTVNVVIQTHDGPVIYAIVKDLHRAALGTYEVSTNPQLSAEVYETMFAGDEGENCKTDSQDIECKTENSSTDPDCTDPAFTIGNFVQSDVMDDNKTSKPREDAAQPKSTCSAPSLGKDKASDFYASVANPLLGRGDKLKSLRWELKKVQQQLRRSIKQSNLKQKNLQKNLNQARSQLAAEQKNTKKLRQTNHDLTKKVEKQSKKAKLQTRMTLSKAQESSECLICMDAACTTAFVPCGHCLCCAKCAKTLETSSKTCPFCRRHITGLLHVRF